MSWWMHSDWNLVSHPAGKLCHLLSAYVSECRLHSSCNLKRGFEQIICCNCSDWMSKFSNSCLCRLETVTGWHCCFTLFFPCRWGFIFRQLYLFVFVVIATLWETVAVVSWNFQHRWALGIGFRNTPSNLPDDGTLLWSTGRGLLCAPLSFIVFCRVSWLGIYIYRLNRANFIQ